MTKSVPTGGDGRSVRSVVGVELLEDLTGRTAHRPNRHVQRHADAFVRLTLDNEPQHVDLLGSQRRAIRLRVELR